MTGESTAARRIAIRLGLALLTLGLIVLVASPDPPLVQGSGPEALQFSIQCKRTGGSPEAGSLGLVTCALVVTGLPDPLEDKVSVTLLTVDDSTPSPAGSAPSDTVVADEAPADTAGTPVLVSRHLPAAPPLPIPVSFQVPEPPPKGV